MAIFNCRLVKLAMLQGCDAPHRADNNETHLTHGCIQHLRHFSGVRREYAALMVRRFVAFATLFKSALRPLGEVAL